MARVELTWLTKCPLRMYCTLTVMTAILYDLRIYDLRLFVTRYVCYE